MWSVLRDLLPKCKDSGISSLDINGTTVKNPEDISNVFNSFFINIGSNLASNISGSRLDHTHYLQRHSPDVQTQFHFKSIQTEEVVTLLNSLSENKATGIDNIQARLLKICSPVISESLTYLFNLSLKTGKVPNEWKSARVTAIFKKGNKTDPGNYRPISILPVLSKLLERTVH
jgi:hypothetical protein